MSSAWVKSFRRRSEAYAGRPGGNTPGTHLSYWEAKAAGAFAPAAAARAPAAAARVDSAVGRLLARLRALHPEVKTGGVAS